MTATASEQNAVLVRRYFAECVNRAGGPDQAAALTVVDELLSSDFVMLYNNEPDADRMRGRERHKQFLVDHARNFPNDVWTVEALTADEDTVACRWRIQATHAKTGNQIDVRAADFFRVENAQLVELRRFLDFKSFEEQLRQRSGKV